MNGVRLLCAASLLVTLLAGCDGGKKFHMTEEGDSFLILNGLGELELSRHGFNMVARRDGVEVMGLSEDDGMLSAAALVVGAGLERSVIAIDGISPIDGTGDTFDFYMLSDGRRVALLQIGPSGTDGFTMTMRPDFDAIEQPVQSFGFTFDLGRMGYVYGQGILTEQKNYREGHFNKGVQRFPMNRGSFERPLFVTDEGTNIVSPLWFTSRGLGLFMDSYSTLDLSFNSDAVVPEGNGLFRIHLVPLEAERELKMDLIVERTTVDAFRAWVARKYSTRPDLPVGARPADDLFTRPIWTSWAAFKWEIDRERILSFAHSIVDNGYDLGYLEIDDKWTPAWGDLRFDPVKFPDAAGMISEIRSLGSKVTAWIPPFVNTDAADFQSGVDARAYVAGGPDDEYPMLVGWWDVLFVPYAGTIDFTRSEGRDWWGSRIDSLIDDYGLDGFKYDAGETCFLPKPVTLGSSVPFNAYPDFYAEWGFEHAAAEMRAGWFGQHIPVLFRMFDKNSEWGLENGMASVLTQYLALGMIGYPFVMPDMLGGNEYVVKCDDELMIRWAQMNALMPCIQYSILPWRDEFAPTTNEIVKKFHDLRATFADEFIRLADIAARTQMPIVRPLFFQFPDDAVTYGIEDQFMLGDRYLVAPVLEKGATSRGVYIPAGKWAALDDPDEIHDGPKWVEQYPAPIERLPAFKLVTN